MEYDWEAILDQETDAVMKERVPKKSRSRYTSQNLLFMIWLFDGNRYHNLIKDKVLELMISANKRDKTKMTKAGKPCKQQIELRNVCGRSLAETDSPIIVEKLLFAIFS